jgi:hypothetical protein
MMRLLPTSRLQRQEFAKKINLPIYSGRNPKPIQRFYTKVNIENVVLPAKNFLSLRGAVCIKKSMDNMVCPPNYLDN